MADERTVRQVDVLVVGAGPAGLSVAAELARRGAGSVEVLEREAHAGGVPRHSAHTGYGVRDRHRLLTGPAYARALAEAAGAAGAVVRTATTATGWDRPGADDTTVPGAVDVTGPGGLERITARAVVLATGARERPRPARLVPGTRPEGVLTTGLLQQLVLAGRSVGKQAVIVGAEHVSYSAALTLAHAGLRVVAMVTDLPRQQSYAAFHAAAVLRWAFPVLTSTAVTRLLGRPRLTGVEVRAADGREVVLAADTVVFTGDWIPDHELARRGGIELDPGTHGPAVDQGLRTSAAGVFAIGNLVHPVETADAVALEAAAAAEPVLEHLRGHRSWPGPGPAVVVEPPLAWIAPNRIRAEQPVAGRFAIWPRVFTGPVVLEVRQGARLLHAERRRRGLVPNRPTHLDGRWTAHVDRNGGSITVTAR